MRSPSHLSSSPVSTGTLVAARVKPALRRRVASSRPSRCGIETMRGADIAGFSLNLTIEIPHGSKTEEINGYLKWNLIGSQLFFPPRAEQQVPTAGLEETLDVNWNDHSYYSRYCIAWRLQRHRRRTILRDRILWRRRTRPCHRDPVDPAIAREAVRFIYLHVKNLVVIPGLLQAAHPGMTAHVDCDLRFRLQLLNRGLYR